MATSTSQWRKNSFILSELVSKDFKLKYRRSVLGVLWSVLNPLLTMIVVSAVFSYIFRFNIENYPLYLILGQILFAFMANSTSSGLNSIVNAASLIKKIRIEKMLFPIESVLAELVNFALSLIAVAAVLIFFQVIPTWNWLFLPLLLVYLVIFCMGISLALSALEVFFRDIAHLWGVFTTLWMYATPIFYPLDALDPQLAAIMHYNPMFQYINYFREIVLYGNTPTLKTNFVCLGVALATFLVGYLIFRANQKKFILYV
jgi:ABC-2 type transport system permease protein